MPHNINVTILLTENCKVLNAYCYYIHAISWYGHAGVFDDLILSDLRCAIGCMFQYYLCHYMDIGTCDIVHWSAVPHNRIASRTVFLGVRCSSVECR